MQIKKNYSDSLSVFFYIMNYSLVHLSLLAVSFIVESPDVKRARQLDHDYANSKAAPANSLLGPASSSETHQHTCGDDAEKYWFALWWHRMMHAILFFICLSRELYSSTTTVLGVVLKAIEVIFMFVNLAMYIFTIDCYLIYFKKMQQENPEPCMVDKKLRHQWASNIGEWFILELLVFFTFVTTMLLFIIKSRCLRVGTNQAE